MPARDPAPLGEKNFRFPVVGLEIDRGHGVGDRSAVGRDLGIAQIFEQKIIFGGHAAPLTPGGSREQQAENESSHS